MGMNSHIHLTLDTETLSSLRIGAEKLEISVSELIRRKLTQEPKPEEIIILRKLKELLNKK